MESSLKDGDTVLKMMSREGGAGKDDRDGVIREVAGSPEGQGLQKSK